MFFTLLFMPWKTQLITCLSEYTRTIHFKPDPQYNLPQEKTYPKTTFKERVAESPIRSPNSNRCFFQPRNKFSLQRYRFFLAHDKDPPETGRKCTAFQGSLYGTQWLNILRDITFSVCLGSRGCLLWIRRGMLFYCSGNPWRLFL